MTDLLSIGASGIRAYTGALGTVADNIANAETAGFKRRTIQTAELHSGGDVVLYRNQVSPGGTMIAGVQRAVDEWLQQDARQTGSEAAQMSARLKWLEAAEQGLVAGGTNVGSSLTGLFNAADQLATDPNDIQLRSAFLEAARNVAGAFAQTSNNLTQKADSLGNEAQATVETFNFDLDLLKGVNQNLRRVRDGSTNQAALLDERDRLLERLSSAIGLTTEFDGKGVATVRLAPPSGDLLVSPTEAFPISLAINADGTLSTASSASAFTPTSGTLAGLASAASTIKTRRDDLDSLATEFSDQFNAAHRAGFDLNGDPGVDIFVPGLPRAANLTIAGLGAVDVAAADSIAANGNLLGLNSLRGPSGGEAVWTVLVTNLSRETATARTNESAASSRHEGARSALADISSVDLDEEAANLLRFQQAYQGSAKVLQVAQETMQSILSIF